jgi:hypothetical protein
MSYFNSRFRSEIDKLKLYPVCKVSLTDNGNVYFIPVSRFPTPEKERKSLGYFLDELRKRYADLVELNLHSCLGILNRVMEFDVLEKVGSHLFDWRSQVAIALFPDQPPPHVPTREEAMSWKQVPSWHEVIPMMTYIAKRDAVAEAYKELFGCGGTILYTSTHEEHKLLAKTKEIFGYKIASQCLQLLNCLPVLEINALHEATENQFRALYSALGLYIGESIRDAGVIIISDRKLDCEIADLLYLLRNGHK